MFALSRTNQEECGHPVATERQANVLLCHQWTGGNLQLGNIVPQQVSSSVLLSGYRCRKPVSVPHSDQVLRVRLLLPYQLHNIFVLLLFYSIAMVFQLCLGEFMMSVMSWW